MTLTFTTEQLLVLHDFFGSFGDFKIASKHFMEIDKYLLNNGLIKQTWDTDGLVLKNDFGFYIDKKVMDKIQEQQNEN